MTTGAEAPGGGHLLQPFEEPGLIRERRLADVDTSDDPVVHIAPHDVVPGLGYLDGERQANLPEGDDDDPHDPTCSSSTLLFVAALRSTASALSSASRPSWIVTTPASSLPRR